MGTPEGDQAALGGSGQLPGTPAKACPGPEGEGCLPALRSGDGHTRGQLPRGAPACHLRPETAWQLPARWEPGTRSAVQPLGSPGRGCDATAEGRAGLAWGHRHILKPCTRQGLNSGRAGGWELWTQETASPLTSSTALSRLQPAGPSPQSQQRPEGGGQWTGLGTTLATQKQIPVPLPVPAYPPILVTLAPREAQHPPTWVHGDRQRGETQCRLWKTRGAKTPGVPTAHPLGTGSVWRV